ncbi:WD40/YVTN repeat-like-containing domain [Phaffia rhodozyma]|uniref:WD40/YVTN repeat-like-containing domain n=1 Tax=Phaffia rhodozyma TaxID=264483 RepID=A0A0F7SPY0_PHARH|nr:WD40/YVTN repeat-like-containing domain [Phaffia rhodozyma]
MASAQPSVTYRLQAACPSDTPRSLQRSQDGQFLVIGSRDLIIVTPDPTFSTGLSLVDQRVLDTKHNFAWSVDRTLDSAANKAEEGGESTLPRIPEPPSVVKCLINNISVPGDFLSRWEEDESADYRVLNFGTQTRSNEISWRMACWSPSGLSSLGGCVLVGLTTNLDVFVFSPPKDPVLGLWQPIDTLVPKLLDASDYPREAIMQLETNIEKLDMEVQRVLDAQTTCLEWSKQVVFPLNAEGKRSFFSDGSLLALGHKGGCITFWLHAFDGTLSLVRKIRVSKQWISSLTWSEWSSESPYATHAKLAYTDPSGSIHYLLVTQNISSTTSLSLSISEPKQLFPPDQRPASALVWTNRSNGDSNSSLLAWAKVGWLYVWSESVRDGWIGWEGTKRWKTCRAGRWAGSTKLGNCCGVSRPTPTSIVFSLTDGSHQLISQLDTAEPIYDYSLSAELSRSVRTMFEKSEAFGSETVEELRDVVMRTSGVSYLGNGFWASIYSPFYPYDMTYTMSYRVYNTFSIYRLPITNQLPEQMFFSELELLLNNKHDNAAITSPSSELLPFILQLMSPSASAQTYYSRLIHHLIKLPSTFMRPSSSEKYPQDGDYIRHWFREGLKDDLWADENIGRLRSKVALATFLSVQSQARSKDPSSVFHRQKLARLILRESLRVILEWVDRVKEFVDSAEDKALINRLIHAFLSLCIHVPTSSTALNLSIGPSSAELMHITGLAFDLAVFFETDIQVDLERLESAMTDGAIDRRQNVEQEGPEESEEDQQIRQATRNSTRLSDCADEKEVCPACGAKILFNDTEEAICEQGHVWGRCSVTLRLLVDPRVRRCINCTRPTLLPPSRLPSRRKKLRVPTRPRSPLKNKPREEQGRTELIITDGSLSRQEEDGNDITVNSVHQHSPPNIYSSISSPTRAATLSPSTPNPDAAPIFNSASVDEATPAISTSLDIPISIPGLSSTSRQALRPSIGPAHLPHLQKSPSSIPPTSELTPPPASSPPPRVTYQDRSRQLSSELTPTPESEMDTQIPSSLPLAVLPEFNVEGSVVQEISANGVSHNSETGGQRMKKRIDEDSEEENGKEVKEEDENDEADNEPTLTDQETEMEHTNECQDREDCDKPPDDLTGNANRSRPISETDEAWLLEELLKAAVCCVFCGGRYSLAM